MLAKIYRIITDHQSIPGKIYTQMRQINRICLLLQNNKSHTHTKRERESNEITIKYKNLYLPCNEKSLLQSKLRHQHARETTALQENWPFVADFVVTNELKLATKHLFAADLGPPHNRQLPLQILEAALSPLISSELCPL